MKRALLVSLLLVPCMLWAAPVLRQIITLTQPDGQQIQAIPHGDEFNAWLTTTDGYAIIKAEDGFYQYAVQLKSGHLGPSGVRVSARDERSASEWTYIAQLTPWASVANKSGIEKLTHTTLKSTAAYQSGSFPSMGEQKLLLLLVSFSDTVASYTAEAFTKLMNQEGGLNEAGSFRDYYLENSYGALDLTTTVVGWLQLPGKKSDYSGQYQQFAYDAITVAEAAGVDFSEFDNDNDGEVDAVAVIHTGGGSELTGSSVDLPSHCWQLSANNKFSESELSFDGVLVNTYLCLPEMYGTNAMTSIGVICHEFGHALGAPDYYDVSVGYPDVEQTGTARWDIMAYGLYNDYGDTPAHISAYQKMMYGWLSATSLTLNDTFQLQNSVDYPQAYQLATATDGEYFLLENRQQKGFDAALPGHGLLIYHVDENYLQENYASNRVNINNLGIYPKIASGSAVNSAACPFPGSAGKKAFTDETTPNSLSKAGEATALPLFNIAEADSVISFFLNSETLLNPQWSGYEVIGDTALYLHWQPNKAKDSVMLVWSWHDKKQTLEAGVDYQVGYTFNDSSRVLLLAPEDTSFTFVGAPRGETQYFSLYAYRDGKFSKGVVQEAYTPCKDYESIPYYEGFETYHAYGPGECWQIMRNGYTESGLNGDWLFDVSIADGVATWQVNTAAKDLQLTHSYVADGSQSMYIAASDNKLHWLVTPALELPQAEGIELDFDIYYQSTGDVGRKDTRFWVKVDTNGVWNTVLDWQGQSNNLFQEKAKVLLNDFVGKTVRLAFIYHGNDAYPLAIDSLSVDTLSSTHLSTVSFMIQSGTTMLDSAQVYFNNDTLITDSLGRVVFEEVGTGNSIPYKVIRRGYNEAIGTINVVDSNQNYAVLLSPLEIPNQASKEIMLYPNPAGSVFYVKNIEQARVCLYNLSGQCVLQQSVGEEQAVHLKNLKAGVYFVQIVTNTGQQAIKKLMVQE